MMFCLRGKTRRRMEDDSICNICGNGFEDSFHAVVLCPRARALRQEMREHWALPDEMFFTYPGGD